MAVLRVVNFGGLIPKADQRALPPAAATEATNLHPNTQEFRPTLSAHVYEGTFPDIENPREIYRMERTSEGDLNTDPASGWLAYAEQTAHARWANAADLTERTTVTPLDGSYPPRVIDATGTDRLLGVPPPADAPVLTLNVGDYYTKEERDDDLKTLRARVLRKIREKLVRAKVGAAYTADLIEGYLENGTETGTEPSPQRARVYQYDGEEGTITDAYTGAATADVKWVQATHKGVWMQATGAPAWMGADGTWHYSVSYHAYGIGYKLVTEATLVTALDEVEYIDTDQAEDIAEKVAAMFDPEAKPAQAVIKPLKEAVEKLEYALDHRPPGSKTSDEVSTEQTAMLTAAARDIWNQLLKNARIDFAGAGE